MSKDQLTKHVKIDPAVWKALKIYALHNDELMKDPSTRILAEYLIG
jgi:hypothetical protein